MDEQSEIEAVHLTVARALAGTDEPYAVADWMEAASRVLDVLGLEQVGWRYRRSGAGWPNDKEWRVWEYKQAPPPNDFFEYEPMYRLTQSEVSDG